MGKKMQLSTETHQNKSFVNFGSICSRPSFLNMGESTKNRQNLFEIDMGKWDSLIAFQMLNSFPQLSGSDKSFLNDQRSVDHLMVGQDKF